MHTLGNLFAQGNEYETFKKVATKTEDVPFVETTSAAVAKAAGLEKAGVVAIQNFKGRGIIHRFSATAEQDLMLRTACNQLLCCWLLPLQTLAFTVFTVFVAMAAAQVRTGRWSPTLAA
jgi:hypothetical protein